MDVPALPGAWVVRCTGCGCTVNACAVNPQTEHADPRNAMPAPKDSLLVACSCCWRAYLYKPGDVFKASPKPSAACMARRQRGSEPPTKTDGALLIAASLVATIRLRGERLQASSAVKSAIRESLGFVRMIMAEMRK